MPNERCNPCELPVNMEAVDSGLMVLRCRSGYVPPFQSVVETPSCSLFLFPPLFVTRLHAAPRQSIPRPASPNPDSARLHEKRCRQCPD